MRFHGVFLVLVMLSLIFTTVCLGMVLHLTNCAYQPYYMEATKSCVKKDKVYSYNNVRLWSMVYLPHDVIVFSLAEAALLGILFSSRKRQPLLFHSVSFLAVAISTGMQIYGLIRHSKPSEDYTNFSEGYAAFCFLSFFCMLIVESMLMGDRAYTGNDEQDDSEPRLITAPVVPALPQQANSTTVAAASGSIATSSAEPPPYSP